MRLPLLARHPILLRLAIQVRSSVASLDVAGFAFSGRLTTSICVTKPNWVRLRYGLQEHTFAT
jgi:hypothetical protein